MNVTPPTSRPVTPASDSPREDEPLLGGGNRLLRSVSPVAQEVSGIGALTVSVRESATPLPQPTSESKSESKDEAVLQIQAPIPGQVQAQRPPRGWRDAIGQLFRDVRQQVGIVLQLGRDHPGLVARMATYGGAGLLWVGPAFGGAVGLAGGIVMGLAVGSVHEATYNPDTNWTGFAISTAAIAASLEPELETYHNAVLPYEGPVGPRVLIAGAGVVVDMFYMAYALAQNE